MLDFSLTQLQQAQEYLGIDDRFVYVAGDVYRLPFVDNLFDSATMIRTLHHMQDPLASLNQVNRVLMPESIFILEYANKQNLKAILRYAIGKQDWNPFSLEAVEFTELNFDFHPRSIRNWLRESGFSLERQLTVSHLRINLLKKTIPTKLLVFLDSILQYTGALWQLTPSVFTRSRVIKSPQTQSPRGFFQCPSCGTPFPIEDKNTDLLECGTCKKGYPVINGIYDFRDK